MIGFIRYFVEGYPTFGGVRRSTKWSQVQREFVTKNPFCAACGCKDSVLRRLEVHHEKPYHLHPELELDVRNLITLCRPHHLFIGHLMKWESYNVDVRTDSATLLKKVVNRP